MGTDREWGGLSRVQRVERNGKVKGKNEQMKGRKDGGRGEYALLHVIRVIYAFWVGERPSRG